MQRPVPLLIVVAAASMTVAGCANRAPANPVPQTSAVAAAATANAADGLECHLEEITGSHFKTRVCLTAGQRALRDAHTQATKDALIQPRGAIVYCPAPKPGGGC